MGRIDEALRRSNVDVGRDAMTSTSATGLLSWHFDAREEQAVEHTSSSGSGPIAATPIDSVVDTGNNELEQWTGLDAAAVDRLVVAKSARPLLVEQFRSLAAILHQAQHDRPLKSIIITSPSPGDGKTYVAVNLALTLSESYRRRVLLIDGDLRRPSLHLMFRIPNNRGLSEALKGDSSDNLPTVQISETLTLLPGGRPEQDPLGSLSSDLLKRIVGAAASNFDWVIIDSPPVGVLADGRLVSETVDAAILVVRAGATRFPDLQAAAETIGRERFLGIVLNAVDPTEIPGEDYYRHYYRENGTDEAAD